MRNYETYWRDRQDTVDVAIEDYPRIIEIRTLSHIHLDKLVSMKGIVTKRTQRRTKIKTKYMDCLECGTLNGPCAGECKVFVCTGSCGGDGELRVNEALSRSAFPSFQTCADAENVCWPPQENVYSRDVPPPPKKKGIWTLA